MEGKFRTRWNVPHAVGAIDGKHTTMKNPKKTGIYYNYKGFFSMVLLALVDAEYRFLWIDCGSSGSLSDAQIINRSELRRMIEDGTLGLPASESLGKGGPDLHYFLLCEDAFASMPWIVKPCSRRPLTREERIKTTGSPKKRVVENAFGILVSRFRVLLGTMEQRPRVVRDIVYTCVVLHNMMRSPQGEEERALQNNQAACVLQNNQAACASYTFAVPHGYRPRFHIWKLPRMPYGS